MKKDKRVLFLINGHGLGNVVRDIDVLKEMSNSNEVYIGANGFAYDVLGKELSEFRICKIRKLNFNIKEAIAYFRELRNLIKSIEPNLVIVDSVYPLVGQYKIVTIRNPIKITSGKYLKSWMIEVLDYLYSEIIPCKKIEMSFKKDGKRGPIFRKEIDSLEKDLNTGLPVMIGSGDSYISERIRKILKQKIDYLEHHASNNITKYKFLKEFENSTYAIIRGGFNSISECILLNKPMVCIPIENHYEQAMNAKYVEQMNYGIVVKESTDEKEIERKIDKFLENIDIYREKKKKNKIRNSREDVIKELKSLIKDNDF